MENDEVIKEISKDEAIKELNILISENESLKYSYFWNNNGNYRQREYTCSRHGYKNEFIYNNHIFDLHLSVSQSRSHTYVDRDYYIDGNKVTLTKVKKLLNEWYYGMWFMSDVSKPDW